MSPNSAVRDIGFVAFWDRTPAEYVATRRDEVDTTARIQGAFRNGRARDIEMFELYETGWSSPHAYMTFWRAPSLQAVVATIEDLEAAGDFKFARSLHLVGQRVRSPSSSVLGEALPTAQLGQTSDAGDDGSALLLRWGGSLGQRPGLATFARHLELSSDGGLSLVGEYDGRWWSHPGGFVVLTAATLAVGEATAQQVRDSADSSGIRVDIVFGELATHYRFGRHLQQDDEWFQTEDTA